MDSIENLIFTNPDLIESILNQISFLEEENNKFSSFRSLCLLNKTCSYIIRSLYFLKKKLKQEYEYSDEELQINENLLEDKSFLWNNINLLAKTAPRIEFKNFLLNVVPHLGTFTFSDFLTDNLGKFHIEFTEINGEIKVEKKEAFGFPSLVVHPGTSCVKMKIIQQLQSAINFHLFNFTEHQIFRILILIIRIIRGDYSNIDYDILVDISNHPNFPQWLKKNNSYQPLTLNYPLLHLSSFPPEVQKFGIYKCLLFFWYFFVFFPLFNSKKKV